jgi:hypothetical protein
MALALALRCYCSDMQNVRKHRAINGREKLSLQDSDLKFFDN